MILLQLQLEHKEQMAAELEIQLTWTKQQLSQTLGKEWAPLEMVDEQFWGKLKSTGPKY